MLLKTKDMRGKHADRKCCPKLIDRAGEGRRADDEVVPGEIAPHLRK